MHHAPKPNDVILGRTVVATCSFIDDHWRPAEELVLFLNQQPPYFTVAHVQWQPDPPVIVDSVDHFNIIPAINGDQHPDVPGYTDMGGDY